MTCLIWLLRPHTFILCYEWYKVCPYLYMYCHTDVIFAWYFAKLFTQLFSTENVQFFYQNVRLFPQECTKYPPKYTLIHLFWSHLKFPPFYSTFLSFFDPTFIPLFYFIPPDVSTFLNEPASSSPPLQLPGGADCPTRALDRFIPKLPPILIAHCQHPFGMVELFIIEESTNPDVALRRHQYQIHIIINIREAIV